MEIWRIPRKEKVLGVKEAGRHLEHWNGWSGIAERPWVGVGGTGDKSQEVSAVENLATYPPILSICSE